MKCIGSRLRLALLAALPLLACDGPTPTVPQPLASESPGFTVSNGSAEGSVFITGHDPDFHAQPGLAANTTGARNLLRAAITFARNGSTKPLLVIHRDDLSPPPGHANSIAGLETVEDNYVRVNAAQFTTATLDPALYAAIYVPSDFGGLLGQAELDALNARSAEILAYLNAGGGLVALAESNDGAHLTPDGGHYGFLPFIVSSTQFTQVEEGNTVTAFGTELGITDADVNGNWSHAIFLATGGMEVVDRDGNGNILSLGFCGGFSEEGVEPVNQAPAAGVGDPYTGLEGSPVTFDGSGSNDPDGDPLTFDWDFGDGNTGTGMSPTHTYADNGLYTVTLTVTDPEGLLSTDVTTAAIANVPPTADAGPDAAIFSGEGFTVNAMFSDPGVDDAPWTYEIDWGDGTTTTGSTSDQPSPIVQSRTFLEAGTYTVTVTVTDNDGGSGSDELTLKVRRILVDIDIKPGSDPNSIKLNDRGDARIAVAILSTATFDASLVDDATATLGDEDPPDTPVARRRNGTLFASMEDVNKDGRADKVHHYSRSELIENGDLMSSTTFLVLLADLVDGRQIRGGDAVRVLP